MLPKPFLKAIFHNIFPRHLTGFFLTFRCVEAILIALYLLVYPDE